MWRGGSFFPGILAWIAVVAYGYTEPSDVAALNVLYATLGFPSQLTGWSTDQQGDPCGQKWRGVTCYESSVTELRIESLGLGGQLSSVYNLNNLKSLTVLNISFNNINGKLPYQLPPNVQRLDVSGNSFTQDLPFSISELASLEYLSVSRNQFNESLNDVLFAKLSGLKILDLSLNQFRGNLPQSFSALSSLTSLYLQNNQFTGTINVLADLPLENLNVENNHFNGSIPGQLRKIENFQFGGNQFNNSPTPATPHSPRGDHGKESSGGGKSSLSTGGIAGIIIAALVVVGLVAAFFLIRRKTKRFPKKQKDEKGAFIPADASERKSDAKSLQNNDFGPVPEVVVQMQSPSPDSVTPRLPISNNEEDSLNQPVQTKTNTYNIKATVYSIADLQMATESFSRDNLIGEGSIGRVYRAQFDDGKVLAVKKINSLDNSQQASKDFMKVVSGISRLHHPNVTGLVGYCCEHGQYLLVYEFQCNGSLHDFLHLSDEYSRPLTWNTRIKIALGTARALEYLHEVCSPSVVHKNFKSANILLDAELSPHLSDSGLSELALDDFQALDQYLGSGYSAPEVVMGGQYTHESDVFSFGVVMLELLTGRKPFDSSRPRQEQSLVRWATPQLHDIDALDRMVDPALKGLYPAKSLSRFVDAIALCVQTEPEFRPPMSEVVQALVRLIQRANMSKQMGKVGEQEHGNEADTHDDMF